MIKLTFPYNRDDIADIKTIPGRKYNAEFKYWTCPPSVKTIKQLKKWQFVLDVKLEAYLQENIDGPPAINNIPGLKMELFKYQKEGVAFIEAHNGRALVADEMGLGKTAQALAWIQLHPELRPALIVVPASVKLNWLKEVQMWLSHGHVTVLSGTKPSIVTEEDIVIINYDILAHWYNYLKKMPFKIIVGDEIHLVKNNSAKRTKAMKKIVKVSPHFIALSGTPIVNRPIEMFNAIRMINPDLFPNFLTYGKTYCAGKHNGFGWDYSGASNTKELHEILSSTIMIRRKKQDVLKDLPDKIRSFVPLEVSKTVMKQYRAAEGNFIEWMEGVYGAEAAEKASAAATLTAIEKLKQLAVDAKINHALHWIEDFLESGEKLVLFAVHKVVIEAIMDRFEYLAVKLDGSVSGATRQFVVDKFQKDAKTRLFVGNIKAAGVGITLTAASNVAFLELPWTPGDVLQCEDRCHRIGQKDTVNIYYLLAQDTIEEEIALLLDEKRKVLDGVLDGIDTDEGSLLTELIANYK